MTIRKHPDLPEPGPPVSLAELLTAVGWSGAELSRRVDCSISTVYKWLHGDCRTPGSVVAYLELILLVRRTGQALKEIDG